MSYSTVNHVDDDGRQDQSKCVDDVSQLKYADCDMMHYVELNFRLVFTERMR